MFNDDYVHHTVFNVMFNDDYVHHGVKVMFNDDYVHNTGLV